MIYLTFPAITDMINEHGLEMSHCGNRRMTIGLTVLLSWDQPVMEKSGKGFNVNGRVVGTVDEAVNADNETKEEEEASWDPVSEQVLCTRPPREVLTRERQHLTPGTLTDT